MKTGLLFLAIFVAQLGSTLNGEKVIRPAPDGKQKVYPALVPAGDESNPVFAPGGKKVIRPVWVSAGDKSSSVFAPINAEESIPLASVEQKINPALAPLRKVTNLNKKRPVKQRSVDLNPPGTFLNKKNTNKLKISFPFSRPLLPIPDRLLHRNVPVQRPVHALLRRPIPNQTGSESRNKQNPIENRTLERKIREKRRF